ncbi:MAG: DMT family transporter [Bacteroidales bacterium]|nr:DMT family transporter [Bacteroidales bacterium]
MFFYTYAQRSIGAARTSTYYAFAPFIGAFLSFVFLKEQLSGLYLVALSLMIAGAASAVADTIVRSHIHKHHHFLTHTHDGSTHSHEIIHAHGHNHYVTDKRHVHQHSGQELEKELDQQ